jgi:hypothetical protein
MDAEKNQRKSARENSEKRFHANVRRLKSADKNADGRRKKSALICERKIQKKDGFTQIVAD